MSDNKRQALYDQAKSSGMPMPDYATFNSLMDDPGGRKKFYDAAGQNKVPMPDYSTYENLVGKRQIPSFTPSDAFKPMQENVNAVGPSFNKAANYFRGGDIGAGIGAGGKAGLQVAALPLSMGLTAVRQLPLGNTVMDVVEAPFNLLGNMLSKSASGYLGLARELGLPISQNAINELSGLVGTAGTIALTPPIFKEGVPIVKNATSSMVRGAARILPDPLTLARDATGISGMSESGVGALERLVREQPPLTNKVPQAFQNVEKTKVSIQNIVDKELSPRIQKLTNEGNELPTSYIEGQAVAYLKKNSAKLNLPTGKIFDNQLQTALDNFRSKYGQTINPSEMQGAKTATHQTVNYGGDVTNPMGGELNKAIANVFREHLEKLDPTLKSINKKIYEKMEIADAQSRVGSKANTASTPFTGLPFYIGVTRSLPVGEALGATRWGTKKINAPSARLSRAGFYDKAKNFGLNRPPLDPNSSPINVPPQISGLLPEPFTSRGNVTGREIPNPTFPPTALLEAPRGEIPNPTNMSGRPFAPSPTIAGQPPPFVLPDNLRMMPRSPVDIQNIYLPFLLQMLRNQ